MLRVQTHRAYSAKLVVQRPAFHDLSFALRRQGLALRLCLHSGFNLRLKDLPGSVTRVKKKKKKKKVVQRPAFHDLRGALRRQGLQGYLPHMSEVTL